jgi:hypothetical protein
VVAGRGERLLGRRARAVVELVVPVEVPGVRGDVPLGVSVEVDVKVISSPVDGVDGE